MGQDYIRVVSGAVVGSPGPLPAVWAETSNLKKLSPDTLRELGFYPVVDDPPEFNTNAQILSRTGYAVGSESVTVTYEVLSLPASALLAGTDLGMIRVVEDLLNILVDGGVIELSDLPQPVQDKLAARAAMREEL